MDSLVNRPNTILERQRQLQADTRPVFQRLPRARLYMGALLTLSAIGTFGVVGGLYNAAHGKKAETAN